MNKFFEHLIFSRELNFLFLSILLFATATGINLVTFPTILNSHGVNASLIGIAFTLDAFGGILMSFFLSKMVSRLNMMRTLKLVAFGYAAIVLLIYFYQNFYLWALLAFFMGALWFAYVITRQSWLNILLEHGRRGVALGIFSMVIATGIAIGPVIVKFTGAASYLSFIASAALTVISYYCLKPLEHRSKPRLIPQRISIMDFFRKNPRVFLARFFLDFQTYLLLTFSVIFGVRIGLSYEAAGLLITAYMASGFFDVLVGFALKKYSPYFLINLGFVGCLCCFLLIFFIHDYHFLLGAYFAFGIFIACIYVSVFKALNEDYVKSKLVAANSAFQLVGSIGAFFGSLIGGFFFAIFGEYGFPITMVLCSSTYLIFLVRYEKSHNVTNSLYQN